MNRLQIGTSESVTFRSKPGPKWVFGGIWILSGLLLGVESLVIMDGGRIYGLFEVQPGAAFPTGLMIGFVGACPLVVRGALVWFREWRGANGLTVTANGLRLVSLSTRRAEWSGLTDFVVSNQPTLNGGKRVCAKAAIVGPAVSKNLRAKGVFIIPDIFPQPIATIVDELNALRPQSQANDAAAAIPIAAVPRPPSPFKMPKWLIVAAVLALVVASFTGFRGVPGTVLGSTVGLLIMQFFLRERSAPKP